MLFTGLKTQQQQALQQASVSATHPNPEKKSETAPFTFINDSYNKNYAKDEVSNLLVY